MKRTSIVFILLLKLMGLPAQELLQLSIASDCRYGDFEMPKDLYRFNLDETENIVAQIVAISGYEQNFELLASNVTSVAAVIDSSGKRYLLYSRRHFMVHSDPWYRIGILAHEISHHLIGHHLSGDFVIREAAEAEADELLGFLLYRMGAPRSFSENFAAQYPLDNHTSADSRQKAIMRGYDRGEASVLITPSSSFYDDGSGNAIPGVPEFPLPPPTCSASCQLDDYFVHCKTLADSDVRLRRALQQCGYFEFRYFYVKNGYAIVTRMEQITDKGYSLQSNRWNVKPMREEAFSLLGYFTSLFTSQPGYFRTFVFVVTTQSYHTQTDKTVRREDAMNWLNEGVFKLPPVIGKIPYSINTGIVALVYEFQISDTTQKASLCQPSRLDAHMHLQYSRLLAALK